MQSTGRRPRGAPQTYRDNRAAARRRRVRRLLENVLAREAPVAPAEVAHLVECAQVDGRGRRGLQRVLAQRGGGGARAHPLEELAVVAWAIRAEVGEDVGEGRHGHFNL